MNERDQAGVREWLALYELTPLKGHGEPCGVCGRCYWHCECEEGHRPPVNVPTTSGEHTGSTITEGGRDV